MVWPGNIPGALSMHKTDSLKGSRLFTVQKGKTVTWPKVGTVWFGGKFMTTELAEIPGPIVVLLLPFYTRGG